MSCVALQLRQEIVSGRFPSDITTIDKRGAQIATPHPWHVVPIVIAGVAYDPKSPTGIVYKEKAGNSELFPMNLDTMIYLWGTREITGGDFVLHSRKQAAVCKGIQRVGQAVRVVVLDFLAGKSEIAPGDVELQADVEPVFAQGGSVSGEGSGVVSAKSSGGGAVVNRGSRGLFDDLMAEERSDLDWKSILTHGKKYTNVLEKIAQIWKLVENSGKEEKVKEKSKDPKKRSAPEKSAAPDPKRQKKTLLVPIILLPSEFDTSSLITVYNVHEFLGNGRWFDPQEKRRDTVARGKTRDKVVIQRPSVKNGGQTKANFEFRSDPEKLSPDDWQRVAAVFVSGQNWQFKHFKPSNDISIILNTCNSHSSSEW
jgi:hypothetical protein